VGMDDGRIDLSLHESYLGEKLVALETVKSQTSVTSRLARLRGFIKSKTDVGYFIRYVCILLTVINC